MIRFPKGSEWRKWDLHVHTPASVLESNFGEDWDVFVVRLFKAAIDNGIGAIGVTDYYLPEGYRILKHDYLENAAKMSALFSPAEIELIKGIYIFPNIEFRLTKLVIGKERDLTWNRKLNYHVLLSGDLAVEKIYSDFISQIQISYDSSAGSEVEKRPLSVATLEGLGRRLIDEHSPFSKIGSPLHVGMLNASVNEEELVKILKGNSEFKDNFLLGLPADEDLSEVHWNSQGHSIRKNLIKQAHFIFSSNQKTINFLLGQADKERQIKEFGCLKPCLWGSDAHDFPRLFVPDNKRNTWVKADLSFEGLKQVIYDPESRVKIQEFSPQQKSSYQTISRVRFVDSSNSIFSSDWQSINPDLTTIIGGKSSGKSLLLYHIAKAVNYVEVSEKINLAKASVYNELSGVDFEVEWTNGDVSRLSDPQAVKPITYIPQLYINHLAEEHGRDQLNALVKSILSQSDQFKEFSKAQERKIFDLNSEVEAKISKVYELRDKYAALSVDLSAYGTRSSIEEEIKRLNDAVQLLRVKSGFTADQEREFLRLTARRKTLDGRKKTLESIVLCSEQAISSVSGRSSMLLASFRDSLLSDVELSHESTFVKGVLASLNENMQRGIDGFVGGIKLRAETVPRLIIKVESSISENEISLIPLLQKVKDQGELEIANNKLKVEEAKLKSINELEVKRSDLKLEGLQFRNDLYAGFHAVVEAYRDYAMEVSKPVYQPEEGMKILAEVSFDEERFNEFVKSFDGRGNLSNLVGDLVDVKGEFIFDIDSYVDSIIGIDKRIRRSVDAPVRRKGVSELDVTKRLFRDSLYVNYVVRYRDDEIAKMSPGKRGLVLLNLILHLSNATHPILIDQPEDNLDNRTIYDQLNLFIRERKGRRQIIMVTHNANLVVAADAECVIVANQAGQQASLDNERFKFEYCSGSLEFSYENDAVHGMLNKKGIRQHVCEILEGGVVAFKERELKYGFRA